MTQAEFEMHNREAERVIAKFPPESQAKYRELRGVANQMRDAWRQCDELWAEAWHLRSSVHEWIDAGIEIDRLDDTDKPEAIITLGVSDLHVDKVKQLLGLA